MRRFESGYPYRYFFLDDDFGRLYAQDERLGQIYGYFTLIAFPVAYLAMNYWLERFAYRTSISWPVFLVAGLAALVIAWLTVSYQSIKAATADPVESLRYD